jgi:hypothetical protein
MKTVLNVIYEILISIGQARAASALARSGQHAAARDLMINK